MDSAVEAMIRLFCDCIYVREDELERLLPNRGLATLWSFDLIARDPDMPGMVFATCAILPIGRDLTVCDRGNAPDGARCPLPPDVVYPAIFENTREFIDRLPDTPCEAMLDIGAGTGIAAMRGARCATHVWASDISSRCELFTEINRRLAGLENLSVVVGDMYEPVAGLTFDRIVTHPPYVPAKETGLIFRDGGQDGEQIIRRVVEGLPQYSAPRRLLLRPAHGYRPGGRGIPAAHPPLARPGARGVRCHGVFRLAAHARPNARPEAG